MLNDSIIVYRTYVKRHDHRAGVPHHQNLIKFNYDVAQLQKIENKLKQQRQKSYNFCDFEATKFDKNVKYDNEALILII
jgi:hypothetical protein